MAKTEATWRNRIVGSGEEAPDQLLANPKNWRIHPKHQQDALAGVLDEVGWVQEVIVNQQTGHLVDGHLRVTLALRKGEKSIPVKYVDLDEREEALILTTLDPLAALANADAQKLDELLQDVRAQDAAVQQMLSDLSEQANAALASAMAQDMADDAKDTVKKGSADDRAAAVDLIFTCGTINRTAIEEPKWCLVHCCLAVKSGWQYGIQSTGNGGVCAASGVMAAHKLQFLDNEFRHYDHEMHLAAVAKHRPKYATVADIMSRKQCEQAGIEYHSFEQIMTWAEELQEHAENVIVIPKIDCITDIPASYMLGYSVPSSYGGTPIPPDKFKGRRVHLLGGSPNKQIAYWQALRDEVVSLDNNYLLKIANYGTAWMPNGTQVSLTELGFGLLSNPLYTALSISLGNFGAFFRKSAPAPDPAQPEFFLSDREEDAA
jgi:hypothetical protein